MRAHNVRFTLPNSNDESIAVINYINFENFTSSDFVNSIFIHDLNFADYSVIIKPSKNFIIFTKVKNSLEEFNFIHNFLVSYFYNNP